MYIDYDKNCLVVSVNNKVIMPDKRVKYEEIDKKISLEPHPYKKKKIIIKHICPICHMIIENDSRGCDCWEDRNPALVEYAKKHLGIIEL